MHPICQMWGPDPHLKATTRPSGLAVRSTGLAGLHKALVAQGLKVVKGGEESLTVRIGVQR